MQVMYKRTNARNKAWLRRRKPTNRRYLHKTELGYIVSDVPPVETVKEVLAKEKQGEKK